MASTAPHLFWHFALFGRFAKRFIFVAAEKLGAHRNGGGTGCLSCGTLPYLAVSLSESGSKPLLEVGEMPYSALLSQMVPLCGGDLRWIVVAKRLPLY